MLALLMRYPITLNRNVIIHSVFSAYFLSNTAIFSPLRLLNLGALGTRLAMLNKAGECPAGKRSRSAN
jgi:hypothetical protein